MQTENSVATTTTSMLLSVTVTAANVRGSLFSAELQLAFRESLASLMYVPLENVGAVAVADKSLPASNATQWARLRQSSRRLDPSDGASLIVLVQTLPAAADASAAGVQQALSSSLDLLGAAFVQHANDLSWANASLASLAWVVEAIVFTSITVLDVSTPVPSASPTVFAPVAEIPPGWPLLALIGLPVLFAAALFMFVRQKCMRWQRYKKVTPYTAPRPYPTYAELRKLRASAKVAMSPNPDSKPVSPCSIDDEVDGCAEDGHMRGARVLRSAWSLVCTASRALSPWPPENAARGPSDAQGGLPLRQASLAECTVCLEGFSIIRGHIPMMLPCGHSFCQSCVAQIPNNRCPTCRSVFSSAKHLPRNFDMINLLESLGPMTGGGSAGGSSNSSSSTWLGKHAVDMTVEELRQLLERKICADSGERDGSGSGSGPADDSIEDHSACFGMEESSESRPAERTAGAGTGLRMATDEGAVATGFAGDNANAPMRLGRLGAARVAPVPPEISLVPGGAESSGGSESSEEEDDKEDEEEAMPGGAESSGGSESSEEEDDEEDEEEDD